jgi:hypothetical protein
LVAKFQSFWYGDTVPPFVQLCAKSFVDNGHRYIVYSYDHIPVPPKVEIRDAEEILPRSEVFFYRGDDGSNQSVAGFANLFRYELLARHGGWWVDSDVLCLTKRVPERCLYLGYETPGIVGNAIIRSPAAHPLVVQAARMTREAGRDLSWGESGPRLVTRLVDQLLLAEYVERLFVTYPIPWPEYSLLTSPEQRGVVTDRTRDRPFLHFWHEMFRREGDLSINSPLPGSFLADRYLQHEISISGKAAAD